MSNRRVVPDTGEELLGPRVERVGVEPEVVDIEELFSVRVLGEKITAYLLQ